MLLLLSLLLVLMVFAAPSSPSPPPPPHTQVRVLLKEPKGPEVDPGATFTYNAAFTHQLYRIKVNNIQLKETAEENTKTNEQVRSRGAAGGWGGWGGWGDSTNVLTIVCNASPTCAAVLIQGAAAWQGMHHHRRCCHAAALT
jgi:hypothetical protein